MDFGYFSIKHLDTGGQKSKARQKIGIAFIPGCQSGFFFGVL
jgi:hypothetical protein